MALLDGGLLGCLLVSVIFHKILDQCYKMKNLSQALYFYYLFFFAVFINKDQMQSFFLKETEQSTQNWHQNRNEEMSNVSFELLNFSL